MVMHISCSQTGTSISMENEELITFCWLDIKHMLQELHTSYLFQPLIRIIHFFHVLEPECVYIYVMHWHKLEAFVISTQEFI